MGLDAYLIPEHLIVVGTRNDFCKAPGQKAISAFLKIETLEKCGPSHIPPRSSLKAARGGMARTKTEQIEVRYRRPFEVTRGTECN